MRAIPFYYVRQPRAANPIPCCKGGYLKRGPCEPLHPHQDPPPAAASGASGGATAARTHLRSSGWQERSPCDVPHTLHQLTIQLFGRILHIQEHQQLLQSLLLAEKKYLVCKSCCLTILQALLWQGRPPSGGLLIAYSRQNNQGPAHTIACANCRKRISEHCGSMFHLALPGSIAEWQVVLEGAICGQGLGKVGRIGHSQVAGHNFGQTTLLRVLGHSVEGKQVCVEDWRQVLHVLRLGSTVVEDLRQHARESQCPTVDGLTSSSNTAMSPLKSLSWELEPITVSAQ